MFFLIYDIITFIYKSLIYIIIIGCCIYEKPRNFGESSSEDSDDECEHCHGHKDAHKKILPHNAETSQESSTPGNFIKKN